MRVLVAVLALVATTLTAAAETRLALVVGNGAYQSTSRLANPVNDAGDLAAALKGIGFEVIVGTDLDKRAFEATVRDFARRLPKVDVALFYYAGHGLQVGGRNYLIPTDAQLQSERDLDFEGVALDLVLKQMELERDGTTSIVLLDACRDNPLAKNLARSMGTRSANVGQGLAQVHAGVGTFVAYSTQPGNIALDRQGRNSPFTGALLKAITTPDRTISAVMIEVRRDVLAQSGGRQVPWDHSALTGDFYLYRASAPGAARALPPAAPESTEARLRQLEEELRRKSNPEQTAKVVELAQARERLKRLEEENQRAQRSISEIMMSSTRNPGPPGETSMKIGSIQMEIGKRSGEMRQLRERIRVLEGELGLADGGGARKP
jgi:uncharacterized caspase-like protein